jgi:hypothetical protein
VELPEGKHFWEVKLLSDNMGNTLIGNSKPNLDPKGWTTVWACCGPWALTAAPSIAFFKNRAQHGYAAAAAGNGNAKQCK